MTSGLLAVEAAVAMLVVMMNFAVASLTALAVGLPTGYWVFEQAQPDVAPASAEVAPEASVTPVAPPASARRPAPCPEGTQPKPRVCLRTVERTVTLAAPGSGAVGGGAAQGDPSPGTPSTTSRGRDADALRPSRSSEEGDEVVLEDDDYDDTRDTDTAPSSVTEPDTATEPTQTDTDEPETSDQTRGNDDDEDDEDDDRE